MKDNPRLQQFSQITLLFITYYQGIRECPSSTESFLNEALIETCFSGFCILVVTPMRVHYTKTKG